MGNPDIHKYAVKFKPGESGNPGGKPKGTRNAINAAFLKALSKDFDAHGVQAIEKAREDDPMGYVRVLAALLPKEIEVKKPLDDISDEQLDAAITAVRAIVAAQVAGSGEDTAEVVQPAGGLQAVPETA